VIQDEDVQTDLGQQIDLVVKRGLLDNLPRRLTISPNYFQFEDKTLISSPSIRFEKSQIEGYRFGIRWIKGFKFIIGREYQLFIHNKDGKEIKIHFKTVYGYKKKELHDKFNQILEGVWAFYFADIAGDYLERFRKEEDIEICNVGIKKKNITIQTSGIFKEKQITIPWNKVATRTYITYYAIYSTDNPADINRGYSYLNDWNTFVLYSVIETLLKERANENN